MANAEVNIKYTENRRGSRTLVLNDYMFRLKTEKKKVVVAKTVGAQDIWKQQYAWPARKNLIQVRIMDWLSTG